MKNEVKINIPLFIGLILLVASVTAILVSGVKLITDYIIEKNRNMYNQFKQIENIVENINNENDVGNTINTIID